MNDNEYQLRDLVIGPTSMFRWHRQPPSLWGADEFRVHDFARESRHGVDGGRDLLGTKTISGEIVILAQGSALQTRLDELAAAWAPSDINIPFVWQRHGIAKRRYGRPRRWALNPHRVSTTGHPVAAVQFEALDPFVYSDVEHDTATGRAVASGGFTPPFTPPFTVGSTTSTGTVQVVNAGNAAAPWRARLQGPLTEPQILHVEQNKALMFDANGGLVITADQFVDVISDGRAILLQGTADVRVKLRVPDSRWFELDPGTQQIELAADAGDGTMTFSWRDTWWT